MGIVLTPQQKLTGISAKWTVTALECLCLAALAIVYISHLGFMPLDIESDEARRALVSGEMMISGNYITPTINGELYLNKPPLYNYIVAGYFNLFGNYSMIAFRLQCIVAVFLTGLLIYFFTKKYTNHIIGFFTALAYMTNGRLLIYESLYGMIDTTFAMVVYANFMLVFYFGEKGKYKSLFIFSYIACAVAFFLKGLPALVFQAITVTTWFGLKKNPRGLFTKDHLYGIAAFLLLTLPYYLLFFSYNDVSLSTVFYTLYNESEKRTFIGYDLPTFLNHLAVFPFEVLYHFLPWTIFLLALFRKNACDIIKQNAFIQFIVWIFLTNIVVYWLSPDVYPKYLFMFVPLLYGTAFYFYFNHTAENSWQKKVIDIIFISACIIMLVASLALPFTAVINTTDFSYLKAGFLIAGFMICSFMVIRNRYRPYFFLAALFLCRAGFNWFVIEQRGERFFQAEAWANSIADKTKGKPLYILEGTDTRNFDGMSFEIATSRNEVLKKSNYLFPGAYYITDSAGAVKNNMAIDLPFENLPDHNKLYLAHPNNKTVAYLSLPE